MIRLANYSEIRYESSDVEDLVSVLTQLKGQPFLGFRISYGEEVHMHLGEPRPFSSPRMKGQARGSFILGSRASSWAFVGGTTLIGAASHDLSVDGPNIVDQGLDEVDHLESEPPIIPGSRVIQASAQRTPMGFMLTMNFSDGSLATIVPRPDAEVVPGDPEPGMEIADWELLTPHSRILRVGPGPRWCYLDSAARPGG